VNALDWRAIGIGAAVVLAFALALRVVVTVFPLEAGTTWFTSYLIGARALGILVDLAGGAAAGWIARQRGTLHGAIAVLLGRLAALVLGTIVTAVQAQGEMSWLLTAGYWFSLLGWLLMATLLGAIAGLMGARLAARRGAGA
jgi:hypothetical protein